MKTYSFGDVVRKFDEYHNVKWRGFRYKDEAELDDILHEIFELDEDIFIEVDYDNEVIIIS